MTDLNKKEISKEADIESVIKDCIMAMRCRYGKFYPNKNYGGKICGDELNEILAGARFAVREIDGVVIKSGSIVDDEVQIDILINDEERSVTI